MDFPEFGGSVTMQNISCTVVFAKSKLVQIHFFVWCILLVNKLILNTFT